MRVGILGGGQLGRMLALEGYPLGLQFRFLEPDPDAPVSHLGEAVVAPYDDPDAVAAFAEGLHVATWEFENVPVDTARLLAGRVRVLPTPTALEAGQDRLTEKATFEAVGIPTASWRQVDSLTDLTNAAGELGLPAVVKTRRLGYDGKGQALVREPSDLDAAWKRLGDAPLILERRVEFDRELSIVGVRGGDGALAFYPLTENQHRDGILYRSEAPAPDRGGQQREAEGLLTALLERLDYVGVLALELFEEGGRLLANEMAPRVHNSGHWTLDGAECSQFENHLRAVCGLPLGGTGAVGHAGMINLLGAVPPTADLLAVSGARLHLYGKAPRPGRKLGHVNALAGSRAAVRGVLDRVAALAPPS